MGYVSMRGVWCGLKKKVWVVSYQRNICTVGCMGVVEEGCGVILYVCVYQIFFFSLSFFLSLFLGLNAWGPPPGTAGHTKGTLFTRGLLYFKSTFLFFRSVYFSMPFFACVFDNY